MTPLRIERLHRRHAVEAFDSGNDALNRFLVRYALLNQQAEASQTYVALAGETYIAGYYTLVVGEVAYEDAPSRLKKGLARHLVPVMVLARLAVASAWQGKGLGSGLLKDALKRTVQAADIAGIRALVVHAKDEAAAAFYRKFDFAPSPSDPHHLSLLLKDVRRLLG